MEEILPSNKMINAMENPVSIQDGIVGALQQPNKGVADIFTWIHCIYAVMAVKCHDLVGPMISHIHTVMHCKLHKEVRMSWLQYDWWSRREMNAEGGSW